MNVPEGLLCSDTHQWILEVEDGAIIGLTDYIVNQMSDIVSLELPEVGAHYFKDEVFSAVESVKTALEALMPVSGKVIEVNEALINSPDLINENPYDNWMIKITPDDFQADSENLMEYDDYSDNV